MDDDPAERVMSLLERDGFRALDRDAALAILRQLFPVRSDPEDDAAAKPYPPD